MNSAVVIKVKSGISRVIQWEHIGISALVLFILGFHFGTVMHPNRLMFDELFYVGDARSIISHHGTFLLQQPPLGKLLIADGMRLFGDNPLGWRFFSIIFGTGCLILIYFICRRLKLSNTATMLTTFFFGLENLCFVQASVAMLDVFSYGFMLAAILLFLRGNLALSGISVGLSALVKLPGALVLAVFFLFWLFTGWRKWRTFFTPLTFAFVSFLILMPLFDYAINSELSNPIDRIVYMLTYAGKATLTSDYSFASSRPWEWIINGGILFYSFNPQYIAMVSLTISISILPILLYMLNKGMQRNQASLLGFIWFLCTYLPWVASSLILNRVTYIYYLYPAIGPICIGLGVGFSELLDWARRKGDSNLARITPIAVKGYLALHLLVFIILSPVTSPWINWFAT